MTTEELEAMFEKHDDCFLEDIPQTRHKRKDIAAFLLLDELCPSDDGADIVSGADHDVIYLDPSVEQLAEANPTEDQVRELIRYGVRIEDDHLEMFA